jgi:hypothetical protein
MRKAEIWMPAWIACALCLGTADIAAAADGPVAEASLTRALPAATDTEIDGVIWHCQGDKCVGTAVGRAAPVSRLDHCRKVASALGKLTRYSSRGREMTARDLDNCNRVAR